MQHEKYMRRCLDLAEMGKGRTAPNPMVGCIIVNNAKIIAEGFHQKHGEAHAEVNAVKKVRDKSLLKESVLYVNLEPCFHTGKTPPCCDLILASGIKKTVIGSIDPNPLVSGKSIEKLKSNGVEVVQGILQKENEYLNRRFFQHFQKKRPYVILKWAQTRDGFIDITRDTQKVDRPTWISNESSRRLVHKWRAEEDAILVGTNTVLMDNPGLNVRDWSGKNPLRIVLDRHLRLPKELKCFDKTIETLVYNEKKSEKAEGLEYVQAEFDENVLPFILNELKNRNIQSVIVEGGKKTIDAFIKKELWDEARVFTGNCYFLKGVKAPKINVLPEKKQVIFGDAVDVFYRKHEKISSIDKTW